MRLDAGAVLDLMRDVLYDAPRLDGARCAGRAPLFDPITADEDQEKAQERIRAAIALCRDCPCLDQCRVVYGPDSQLYGVVAGEYREPPRTFTAYSKSGGRRVVAS